MKTRPRPPERKVETHEPGSFLFHGLRPGETVSRRRTEECHPARDIVRFALCRRAELWPLVVGRVRSQTEAAFVWPFTSFTSPQPNDGGRRDDGGGREGKRTAKASASAPPAAELE